MSDDLLSGLGPNATIPSIDYVEGFRRVFLELGQPPLGLVSVSEFQKLDQAANEAETKYNNHAAARLFRAIRAHGRYYTHHVFRIWDLDGDKKPDFYFYREYELGKFGVEFYLTRHLTPTELLSQDQEESLGLLRNTALQHTVSLVAAPNWLLLRTGPTDIEAVMLQNQYFRKQERLVLWNQSHGPDRFLVLDEKTAPEGMRRDMMPGTPEYDEALAFVREHYLRPMNFDLFETGSEVEGEITASPFNIFFDVPITAGQESKRRNLTDQAFKLFMLGFPRGKQLASPDIAPRIKIVFTNKLQRVVEAKLDPGVLKKAKFSAATDFLTEDPADTSRITEITIYVEPESANKTFRGRNGEVTISLETAVLFDIIKELDTIMWAMETKGIPYTWQEGEWSAYEYHLELCERRIDILERDGEKALAEMLRAYVHDKRMQNDQVRKEIIESAFKEDTGDYMCSGFKFR